MRKSLIVALVVVVAVAGALAIGRSRSSNRPASAAAVSPQETEPESDGEGFEEGGDPDASAENHVGTTRVRNRVLAPTELAASGWAGEVQVANEDTWEPYVAADPSSGYVYVMYNRFGITCKRCPNPQMQIRISADGGQTWAPEKPMCTCTGVAWQYDPVLATTASGAVYATWMNANAIVFSKSTNHGTTWSTPLKVSGNSWADKPWLGVSSTGNDVYVAYESRSQLQFTSSHNGGTSFSSPITVNTDSSVYRYPNGFAVLSAGTNGTAVMAASKYSGGSTKTAGPVDIEVWRTTNGGTSWSKVIVDGTVFTGVDFETSSTTTIAADSAGTLVAEYSGATSLGTVTRIFTKRSTDGGLTWGPRVEVGTSTANGSFPAIAAKGAGDFRLTYMDNSTGAWNVWYRASHRRRGHVVGAAARVRRDLGHELQDRERVHVLLRRLRRHRDHERRQERGRVGAGRELRAGPGSIWFNRQT